MSLKTSMEKFQRLLEQEMARVEAFSKVLDRVMEPLQSSSDGNMTSSPDSSLPVPATQPPKITPQEPPKTTAINPNDYHNHDARTITSSSLRDYMRSPLYYYHRYVLCDVPATQSRTLSFGSAVHCLALEPEEFSLRFYVDPNRAGSTASRDLASLNEGLERLTETEYKNAKLLADMCFENPWAQANVYAQDVGAIFEKEFSVHTPDGLTLKCKPDCLTDNAIIDLKTFGRVQSEFEEHAKHLGYHIQASFYAGVLALSGDPVQRDFVFWVICKSAPYKVFQYVIPYEELVDIWERDVRPALRRLRESLQTNNWADVSGTTEEKRLNV